jgi:hypothetical protein
MLDPVQAAGSVEPVTLAGSTYPVRQLRFGEWAELHGWLRHASPNPVRVAVEAVSEAKRLGKPIDADVVRQLYDHAQTEARAWPPAMGGVAWLRALDAVPEGSARLVQMALRGGGTDLPIEDCQRIIERASNDEAEELLRVAYWGGPSTAPKSPAPVPTLTSTPTTTEPACSTGV